jgi:DNA repair protein RecO (recombination protein O)
VRPDGRYVVLVERGVVPAQGDEGLPAYLGKTLLDMTADEYDDPRTLVESKLLMRQLMAHTLGGQVLQSRRVFIELQDM